MKTVWDYTELADSYLKRPEYAPVALEKLFKFTDLYNNTNNKNACDVGAGVAHLTIELAKLGINVYAVEPNDAMRKNGIERTKEMNNVLWFEGVGENTNMKSDFFDIVTFGSSFNVCDRELALKETYRILNKNGYFACMWNHRNLEDSIQKEIENIIKKNIKNYDYGTRREDQTEIINKSNLFEKVEIITGDVIHNVNAKDFAEGFKSHATIHRQSKEIFNKITEEIDEFIMSLNKDTIAVPYTTKIWVAKVKK